MLNGNAMCVALLLALGCSAADDGDAGASDGAAASGAGMDGDATPTTAGQGMQGDGAQGSGMPADGDAGDGGAGASGAAGDPGSGAQSGGDGDGDAPVGDDGATQAGTCEATGAFSGPMLRDCNLPGACGRCMWEKACASFQFRCAKDADCVCMAECVAVSGVNAVQTCLGQCALGEIPAGFAEWVKGASDMCWDEGCGTLAEPVADPAAPSGGETGAGSELDCGFDDTVAFDPCGEVLQLESEDGSLCVRIERRDDGPGGDANTGWTLLDARIGPRGQVCHVEQAADLCWFSSHHNYADWAHITCGELHYDLNMAKNCGTENRFPSPTFRLHVFEGGPGGGECAPTADGSCPVVEPIELFPAP